MKSKKTFVGAMLALLLSQSAVAGSCPEGDEFLNRAEALTESVAGMVAHAYYEVDIAFSKSAGSSGVAVTRGGNEVLHIHRSKLGDVSYAISATLECDVDTGKLALLALGLTYRDADLQFALSVPGPILED